MGIERWHFSGGLDVLSVDGRSVEVETYRMGGIHVPVTAFWREWDDLYN